MGHILLGFADSVLPCGVRSGSFVIPKTVRSCVRPTVLAHTPLKESLHQALARPAWNVRAHRERTLIVPASADQLENPCRVEGLSLIATSADHLGRALRGCAAWPRQACR